MEYKSRGDKDKILSFEDYFKTIRQYLRNMKNNQKIHGEWKIQLIMWINFISSFDTGQIRTKKKCSKSNNVEIIMGIETDHNIKELFESFFKRY